MRSLGDVYRVEVTHSLHPHAEPIIFSINSFSPTAAPPAGVLISYSRIGCPKILAKSLQIHYSRLLGCWLGCWAAGSAARLPARVLGCWLGCPGARSGAGVLARLPGCPLGFPGSRVLSFEFWLSGEGRGGTQRRFSSFGSREKRAEVHNDVFSIFGSQEKRAEVRNDVFRILALRRSPRRYTTTFF